MTDQPTDDPIGDTTPETARALLWRHGLPEDVIDGALALFAQELAGKIRAHRDHTRGAVQATKVMDFAADLISPEHWARTVPAVPVSSPPPNQTAAERLFSRVLEFVTSEVVTAKTEFGNGYREAQRDIRDLIRGRFDNDAANELRRLAAEAQQPDTETRDALMQAHVALAEQAGRDQAALARVVAVLDEYEGTDWSHSFPAQRIREATAAVAARPTADGSEPPVHKGGNADDCPA